MSFSVYKNGIGVITIVIHTSHYLNDLVPLMEESIAASMINLINTF